MAEALERLYYDMARQFKQQNRSLKLLAAVLTVISGGILIISLVKSKRK